MKKIVLYSLVLWGFLSSIHAMQVLHKAPTDVNIINHTQRKITIDSFELPTLEPLDVAAIPLKNFDEDILVFIQDQASPETISRGTITRPGDYRLTFKDNVLKLECVLYHPADDIIPLSDGSEGNGEGGSEGNSVFDDSGSESTSREDSEDGELGENGEEDSVW